MKVLHPDLHPETAQARLTLFDHAVSAYKNGDLETLKMIGELVADNPEPKQYKDALEQLSGEKERLKGLLQTVQEEIKKIKSEYPYTVKIFLEDEEKTKQRKQELQQILEQYHEWIAIYRKKIEEMVR